MGNVIIKSIFQGGTNKDMKQEAIDLSKGLEEKEILKKRYCSQAKKVLSDKYGKTFEIYRIDRLDKLEKFYQIEAASSERPDLRFLARIEKDGDLITDQYISRGMGQRAEEILSEILMEDFEVFSIKAGWGIKWSKSNETKMTLEHFISLNPKNPLMIYLDVLWENGFEIDVEKFYGRLMEMAGSLLNVSGVIVFSIIPLQIFSGVVVYLREHANVDGSYYLMKEGYRSLRIPFGKGKLAMSKSEFRTLYEEGGNLWNIQPKI